MAEEPKGRKTWVELMEEDDLSFVKRFMLASGSLKELAEAYGITYPTIRLRLNRLIDKIKILDRHEIMSDFERILRAHYVDGKIDISALKTLLAAHRRELAGCMKDRESKT